VDSHEMGAMDTYLFNPPRAPFNPFLPKPYINGGTILLKTRQQLLMNMVGVIIPGTGMKNFIQGMAVRGVFTLD